MSSVPQTTEYSFSAVELPHVGRLPASATPFQLCRDTSCPLTSPGESYSEGTVMVIDDDSCTVDLMVSFLALYGVAVKGFTNPCNAVEWFEVHSSETALVFLDMCNPIMNGEDCFPILRSIDPCEEIVLISGRVDPAIVNGLMEQGALCFVPKPFDFPTLVGWILHRLGRAVPVELQGEAALT